MKKDLLALFALVLVIALLISGTEIQSVDDYYLTHIDDITPESETVTFSIRCDTILANYDELEESLRSPEFVPPDGIILPATVYVLREGDTVFDVLSYVCDKYKIHMSYRGGTGSGCYVEGINNLYEFDGGRWSGWMYCVNDWYPNYGCGVYYVKAGEVIEWNYTCDLGLDLDAGMEGAEDWKKNNE